MAGSAYAAGFSTLQSETVLDTIPVQGQIPQWLSGTLIRTGPAQFEVGPHNYRHWFDGLAMLHRFSFRDGRVSYANRFLQSQAYCKAKQTGRISLAEFGTDPCLSLFGRVRSLFVPQFTDNANVNVQRMVDRFVALTETPLPISFDPQTLETLAPDPFDPPLTGQLSTAHPHFDFATRQAFNYQVQFGRVSRYQIFAVDRDHVGGKLIGSLATDKPAYMHSFGMTQQYLVLTEFPLVVSPIKLLLSGLTKTPFIENYRWRPERGIRFSVIRKEDGHCVAQAESDAGFAFHHVNAYEQLDEIIVDLALYDDSSVIDLLYLDTLRRGSDFAAARLVRFRVPLDGSRVAAEALSEEKLDLPRINYRQYNSRPYRFVYGAGTRLERNFIDQLVKIDISNGTSQSWFEEGCYPGEPVFVADPDDSREDAGLILSVVLDGQSKTSFLLVLDATSFAERGRAPVPHHIPFGFHGQFFGSAGNQG